MDFYKIATNLVAQKRSPFRRPNFWNISTNTKTPFIELYFTSILSACNAELFVYPLDVCKTRMQIQGESVNTATPNAKYRGLIATATGIVREEGATKLYGGVSAMLLRHAIFSGLKMYAYDALREELIITDSEDGKPKLTFTRSAICGTVAGVIASISSSPTDLIKVQMQMEGKRRLLGEPPRIHNVYQAFTSIYGTGGIPGLWKGTVPNIWRAALMTIGDVSIYDLAKRWLMTNLCMPDNRLIQFMGAMIAGFAGAALSSPADVVKSRIMNQPTDARGRGLHYQSTIDCFTKLVRKEGISAMYKGFLPYWIRVGPWTMVFWMTFEQIRRLRGNEGY